MEDAIQLFSELNRQEHDFAIAFYTEPDRESFRAVRKGFRNSVESGWFPAGYRKRPGSFEDDEALPNNFTKWSTHYRGLQRGLHPGSSPA